MKNFLLINDEKKIDLAKLIDSRALIQANSGGGKSWAIRRIVEQAYGKVQIIIIDPEGEFSTLREKYDFILAGKGGDVATEMHTAGKLAERLLKLGANAIIDLYELNPRDRKHYVRLFFEATVNSPKELWHPVMYVLDEAHKFAPEKEESEALEAVADMASRGRKRGFCLIPATQRPAKLNKDVAAECNNKLIGRASLDIDRKRSAEELGFTSKEETLSLRNLKPGQFYVFGPAISDQVELITVGDVMTSHPKAGSRIKKRSTPPTAKIRAMIKELGDLPKEVEEEQTEVMRLRTRVVELERKPAVERPVVDKAAISSAVRDAVWKHGLAWEKVVKEHVAYEKKLEDIIDDTAEMWRKRREVLKRPTNLPPYTMTPSNLEVVDIHINKDMTGHPLFKAARPVRENQAVIINKDGDVEPADGVPKPAIRLLEILVSRHPMRMSASQLAMLAGIKSSTGTFKNYISTLKKAGLITEDHGDLAPTDEGIRQIGTPTNAPRTSDEIVDMWKRALPTTQCKIFSLLVDRRPLTLSNGAIADELGIKHTTGTFKNYISSLYKNKLIVIRKSEAAYGGQEIAINDDIFRL